MIDRSQGSHTEESQTAGNMTHAERLLELAELMIRCTGNGYGCLLDMDLEGLSVVENCSCKGTGKVACFPMLRQECPDEECQTHGGYVRWETTWMKHSQCQGRGWVPVDSLQATTSAYEFMRDQTNAKLFSNYMWACARGDKEAVVLAIWKAKQEEKEEKDE